MVGFVFQLCISVGVGVAIMWASAVSPLVMIVQIVALFFGILSFILLQRITLSSRSQWWLTVMFLGLLAATLLAPGEADVHRWLSLGPIRLNIGFLVGPWIIVQVVRYWYQHSPKSGLDLLLPTGIILFIQPDRGQLIGLSCGIVPLVFLSNTKYWKVTSLGLIAVGYLLAYFAKDTLEPVAHVERILQSASALSPFGGIAAWLAAVTPIVYCLYSAKNQWPTIRGWQALGLGGYVFGNLVASQIGQYPVAFVGYGASPIVGLCLGLGLLSAPSSTAKPSITQGPTHRRVV